MSGFIPESLRSCPPGPLPESLRSCPPLILTAHGSADPRSAAVTHAVADEVRRLRAGLDVRVAFCENSIPNLRDVLADLEGPAVLAPLLLASAYHARVDIPTIVAESAAGQREDVLQAATLGEDPRLIDVLHQRLIDVDVEPENADTGVLVVAVGSSHAAANASTATLASALSQRGGWARVRVAYATAQPSVTDGIADLRHSGARRIALAPWFIAPGRITDRVAEVAAAEGVALAEPLGAHPLLAQTVLDRFDQAVARRLAA
jgi:sirohydrochlorin ferrochelatase